MKNNRFCGNVYEEKAVLILEKASYTILERNYRTKHGEIDIIAEKEDILVFVEVKYRRSSKFGYGEDAVTSQKMFRIFQVAQEYVTFHALNNMRMRFDCISFLGEEYIWKKDIAWGDEIGCEMFEMW